MNFNSASILEDRGILFVDGADAKDFLQNIITNDINKVTELLGRHKTLPVPSMVNITNLDNGLSINIKIIDRHEDNTALIQVSRNDFLDRDRNHIADPASLHICGILSGKAP